MRKAVIGAAMAFTLAGCTMGPDYVRPEVDAPDTWRLDYAAAQDVANAEWWRRFEDPVLDDLIENALRENKDLRIAASRVEQFAALVDRTRSGFYPQVGYDVLGARERASEVGPVALPSGVDPISDTYRATINVGWELDVWGRLKRATEASRADLLASEEGRRTVILSLVSSVATSYITLLSLDRQLEIARRTLATRAESVKLFETQFKGGVVGELTVAQIRSEYWQAAVAIPPLERDIAQLENSLSVLLGRNPGPIPRGTKFNRLARPDVPAALPSELLNRRPDLRQAEANLIAANANIGVVRAAYFPSISLTGLLGTVSGAFGDLFSSGSEVWGIGAGAFGPIFTGGRLRADVRITEAQQQELLTDYQRAIQTAFREVDDALVATQKAREELAAQNQRVSALSDYSRLAKIRYDNGYTSYIEVLDAERSLFDSQLRAVQAQNNFYVGLINTYKAMGGGWVDKAEEIATPPPPADDVPEPQTTSPEAQPVEP